MYNFSSKITKYSLYKEGDSTNQEEVILPTDVKLPNDSPARVKVLRAEGRKWYLTVVYHEATEQPFALFCHTNNREKTAQTSDAIHRLEALAYKKGILKEHIQQTIDKCENENNVDKLTRMISLLLRHGVLIRNVVSCLDQMEDIYVGSFLFQLKKFMSQYIKDGETVDGESCSSCGGRMVFSEGCQSCIDCGNSHCG